MPSDTSLNATANRSSAFKVASRREKQGPAGKENTWDSDSVKLGCSHPRKPSRVSGDLAAISLILASLPYSNSEETSIALEEISARLGARMDNADFVHYFRPRVDKVVRGLVIPLLENQYPDASVEFMELLLHSPSLLSGINDEVLIDVIQKLIQGSASCDKSRRDVSGCIQQGIRHIGTQGQLRVVDWLLSRSHEAWGRKVLLGEVADILLAGLTTELLDPYDGGKEVLKRLGVYLETNQQPHNSPEQHYTMPSAEIGSIVSPSHKKDPGTFNTPRNTIILRQSVKSAPTCIKPSNYKYYLQPPKGLSPPTWITIFDYERTFDRSRVFDVHEPQTSSVKNTPSDTEASIFREDQSRWTLCGFFASLKAKLRSLGGVFRSARSAMGKIRGWHHKWSFGKRPRETANNDIDDDFVTLPARRTSRKGVREVLAHRMGKLSHKHGDSSKDELLGEFLRAAQRQKPKFRRSRKPHKTTKYNTTKYKTTKYKHRPTAKPRMKHGKERAYSHRMPHRSFNQSGKSILGSYGKTRIPDIDARRGRRMQIRLQTKVDRLAFLFLGTSHGYSAQAF